MSRISYLPRQYGFWLNALVLHPKIEFAFRRWAPDLIIPLDDVAAMLLRGLALRSTTSRRLRQVLISSLGVPTGYRTAGSRNQLMQLAEQLGIRVPDSRSVACRAEALQLASAWGYPVVLKFENTCGGNGVTVAQSAEDIDEAFARVQGAGPVQRAARWGKLSIKRVAWELAGFADKPVQTGILQRYIEGTPAMRTVAAWKGRVLDGISFVAVRTHPAPVGPSTVVRHIEHPEIEISVARIVETLGCSGLVSFDFLLSPDDGTPYMIEMNPRPIGTGHLGWRFGHDVCGALARQLGIVMKPEPVAAQETRLVALFPKEMTRDLYASREWTAADVLHDIPSDDLGLMKSYAEFLAMRHGRQITEIYDAIAEAVARDRPASPDESHSPQASETPARL